MDYASYTYITNNVTLNNQQQSIAILYPIPNTDLKTRALLEAVIQYFKYNSTFHNIGDYNVSLDDSYQNHLALKVFIKIHSNSGETQ